VQGAVCPHAGHVWEAQIKEAVVLPALGNERQHRIAIEIKAVVVGLDI
jgi:hypothetical protein